MSDNGGGMQTDSCLLYTSLNQKRPALIASLPGNRLDLAKAAVECGADVVKVHMNVQHRASGLHFGTFEEEKETLQEILSVAKGPCGIVAGNSVQDLSLIHICIE